MVPPNANGVLVSLYYQGTSREYVSFLRDEINGTGTSLPGLGALGDPAYLAQSDPFFEGLSAWGNTIWALWDHNKNLPGAAPILMTEALVGTVGDLCASPGSDGTPCNDGDLCTLQDVCTAGSCVGTSPVTCSPIDACHGAGTCDPATGVCSQPTLSDGTSCDDGDGCTQTDQCLLGSCVGSNDVVCTALDACHVAGICDTFTGDVHEPAGPRRHGLSRRNVRRGRLRAYRCGLSGRSERCGGWLNGRSRWRCRDGGCRRQRWRRWHRWLCWRFGRVSWCRGIRWCQRAGRLVSRDQPRAVHLALRVQRWADHLALLVQVPPEVVWVVQQLAPVASPSLTRGQMPQHLMKTMVAAAVPRLVRRLHQRVCSRSLG